jgi:hypothetical protein
MRIETLKKTLAACSFLLCFGTAAIAQTQLFSEPQRKAIGELVREYLLQNPEVLQEALVELEKRQAETQRAAAASALRES